MYAASTTQALTDLDFLAEFWPDLDDAISPGTRRPRTVTPLTHSQQALRDAAARLEQLERSSAAPGESPAPIDIDALDLVSEIGAAADTLARELGYLTRCPGLPPIPSLYADPLRWLDYTGRRLAELDGMYTGYDGDNLAFVDALIEQANAVIRRLAQKVALTLGMVFDGQTIHAICPWCDGTTDHAPTGGEHTWRVRLLPGSLIAIVCESGWCEPPDHQVGTWWGSKPVWPIERWENLAKCLTATERNGTITV